MNQLARRDRRNVIQAATQEGHERDHAGDDRQSTRDGKARGELQIERKLGSGRGRVGRVTNDVDSQADQLERD